MAQNMRANINLEKNMEKEDFYSLMEVLMMGILYSMIFKVKVLILGQMEENILGNG